MILLWSATMLKAFTSALESVLNTTCRRHYSTGHSCYVIDRCL